MSAVTAHWRKARVDHEEVSGFLAVPITSVLAIGAGTRISGKRAPAQSPESTTTYYPAPESAGGWRRCKNKEEVRQLAGMDPQKLDLIGRENTALYGGPWALLVVRHGYIAGEWMGVPAMPQTTFDVWSCTKSATGIAYGSPTTHRSTSIVRLILTSPKATRSPTRTRRR